MADSHELVREAVITPVITTKIATREELQELLDSFRGECGERIDLNKIIFINQASVDQVVEDVQTLEDAIKGLDQVDEDSERAGGLIDAAEEWLSQGGRRFIALSVQDDPYDREYLEGVKFYFGKLQIDESGGIEVLFEDDEKIFF